MNSAKRDEPGSTRSDAAWRRHFVSNLFHELGQPLTALHCSLELALRKPSTREDLRNSLQQAMELSTRLLRLTAQERQMADAEDPGDPAPMDLSGVVRVVAEEIRPVAESLRKRVLVASSSSVMIYADRQRMQRALFALTDLYLHRLRARQNLLLAVAPYGEVVMCYVGEHACPIPTATDAHTLRAFEIDVPTRIISRMVMAAGGSMREHFLVNHCACVLSFPADRVAETVSAEAARNFTS
ncbi:MAG: histidine kinase dimerization/phospho-acceptor domain-containing protein [Acidobacteriaceae bacterium]